MVDVITCGFAAVQALAEDPSSRSPSMCTGPCTGAITRDPLHGISMLAITRLVRMCGATPFTSAPSRRKDCLEAKGTTTV
jgi:ribulose-bisphosphate carboxylase large chain